MDHGYPLPRPRAPLDLPPARDSAAAALTEQAARFSAGATLTGGAGEVAHIQVINPADSDYELTVEQAIVTSANGGRVILQTGTTRLGTLVQNGVGLAGPGSRGRGELRSESRAAVAESTLIDATMVANGQILLDDLAILLHPGNALTARHLVATAPMQANFIWRERRRRDARTRSQHGES